MDNHLSQIDERLRQLEDAIGRLAARVTALEEPRTERLAFGMPAVRPAMAAARPALPPGRELELPILTLVGRTFLVFGGAYLLRALTESGQLTPASGIVVGLTYASAWMGAADRAAVRRPASGLFHGLASLVIACPLLLEASTRFGVLSPASAAALLVLVTALALGVAWHRRLQSLAIMATVAGSITALVLAISTGQVWPFTFSALVIGVGAGIAGASRDWRWPSRAPVIVATLLTLDVAARALAETPIEPRGLSFIAALLLAAIYLVALVSAVLEKHDEPPLLDLMLSGGAVLAGLGGALSIARALGPGALTSLGWSLMLLGLVGYVIAWSRRAAWADYTSAVLTTVTALFILIGVVVGMNRTPAVLTITTTALVLQMTGAFARRRWLVRQGAVFAVAAAAISGLLMFALDAWTAAPPAGPVPRLAFFVAVAAALCAVGMPLIQGDRTAGGQATVATLGAVAALGLGAFALVSLASVDGRAETAGLVAAERSLVASIVIMGVMGLARIPALSGLRWLAYSAIGVVALKLVVEDFRVSSPMSLFVALGAFGTALIVTAKLRAGTVVTNEPS
jgi:hypothetical protein